MHYYLRVRGWSSDQLKLLMFSVRNELIAKTADDLFVLTHPLEAFHKGMALGFNKPPSSEPSAPDPRLLSILADMPLVNRAGESIPTSSLAGKNIGLYFGADWLVGIYYYHQLCKCGSFLLIDRCPPCHKFRPVLATAYAELKKRMEDFEVVFISLDKNQAGFDKAFSTMPWLAVPFEYISVHQVGFFDFRTQSHHTNHV